MVGSDENNSGVIGLSNLQEVGFHAGGGKWGLGVGHNRRALSSIDRNIIGAPSYPCAVNKNVFSDKFAAQMSNKEQLIPEETKKPQQLVQNHSESEDCTIIDVEDYRASIDVPMFLQHTSNAGGDRSDVESLQVEMEDS